MVSRESKLCVGLGRRAVPPDSTARFLAPLRIVAAAALVCCAPAEFQEASDSPPDDQVASTGSRAAELPVIFSLDEVHGFDVSHHQGEIDWAVVPETHFVFLKATEGVDYLDPLFAANWRGAGERNLLRGAYHMFRPEDEVEPQVRWFVEQLRAVGFEPSRDLPPTLDVERNSGVSKVTPEILRQRAEEFLVSLEQALGVKPLVYTNPTFWRDELEPEHQLLDFPLWLAAYTGDPEPPETVDGWETWTFWQHTDAGEVDGVPKPADLNRFHGSGRELQRLMTISLQR